MKVKILPSELEERIIEVIECLFLDDEDLPKYTRSKLEQLSKLYRNLEGNKFYRMTNTERLFTAPPPPPPPPSDDLQLSDFIKDMEWFEKVKKFFSIRIRTEHK